MKWVIAFSLYGDSDKYCEGAVINVHLAEKHYPDWICRFYIDNETVPVSTIKDLHRLGAEVLIKRHSDLVGKMRGWRFLAAADPEVDVMISRDADSRLNPRGAAAVEEWLESDKSLHIMRDHQHHCCHEMYGGMWGYRGHGLLDMPKKFEEFQHWDGTYPPWNFRITDMAFLTDYLWPKFYPDDLFHHASMERCKVAHKKWNCLPFPSHDPYDGFVGEVIMPGESAL